MGFYNEAPPVFYFPGSSEAEFQSQSQSRRDKRAKPTSPENR